MFPVDYTDELESKKKCNDNDIDLDVDISEVKQIVARREPFVKGVCLYV